MRRWPMRSWTSRRLRHADATIREVLQKRMALVNLYTLTPEQIASEKDLAAEVEMAFARPASPYDSHPPAIQRIAWLKAFAARGALEPAAAERDEAWSLFTDAARIQEQMTQQFLDSLAGDGMFLPTP
ncbi:hypothetical protein [Pendulispora albinea]|uniref:Uncharacterized protein n=1 Tax=Pendulispora albinea TaxID=2741071 RepID=A0ABZ2MBF3_9BACT